MEAQTDLAFLRRARRSIVIADSSKIGKVTFARICTVSDVDHIITDHAVTDEQMRSLSSAGAQVTTV
jgi:DeoR family transcriptional regulator of aga operon